MSGSPGRSSRASPARDAALMSGSASAVTTRPASPYRSGARSSAASSLPGWTAATTRIWPSSRLARLSIINVIRPTSNRSASSRSTVTGTSAETAATARAARASTPCWPAGLGSQVFCAAVAPYWASNSDTWAAIPDTNRPPTPSASPALPAAVSSPNTCASRERPNGASSASLNAFASTARPASGTSFTLTEMATGASGPATMAPNSRSTVVAPQPGGTSTRTTREPIRAPLMSSHHSASSSSTA